MTKREVMIRAHEIARLMTGDYIARMSYALRQAWKEARSAAVYEVVGRNEIVVRASGCTPARLRLNRWTKMMERGVLDRVYVNRVKDRYVEKWGYLDLVTGRFVWEVPYTNPTLFSTVEAAVKHYARRVA